MREFGGAEKARDRRLRAKLLFVLNEGRRHSPNGHLLGRVAADSAESLMPSGQGFNDDAHALTLLRDLVSFGFASERPRGTRRRGEEFSVDHCEFAITAAGIELLNEDLAPHAMVDDDRIAEGK